MDLESNGIGKITPLFVCRRAFNCCRWNCNQFCRSTCDTCRSERGPLRYEKEAEKPWDHREIVRDSWTKSNGEKYKIIL